MSEGLIFFAPFWQLCVTQDSARETGATPRVGPWHPINDQLPETVDQSQSS